ASDRQVRKGCAPAVAGGPALHQSCVEPILHVPAQDAVLDEHRALRGMAFIVEIERSAALAQRAVVDDGDTRRGAALSDASAERARALAIEITLESVPDGFVQQDARPTVA